MTRRKQKKHFQTLARNALKKCCEKDKLFLAKRESNLLVRMSVRMARLRLMPSFSDLKLEIVEGEV